MMDAIQILQQYCPYCGEPIDLFIDGSVPQQSYVEDCQVCCRPMVIALEISDDDQPVATLKRDDE